MHELASLSAGVWGLGRVHGSIHLETDDKSHVVHFKTKLKIEFALTTGRIGTSRSSLPLR